MKGFLTRLVSGIGIVAVYIAAYLLRGTVGLELFIAFLNFGAIFEIFKVTWFEERRFLYPFALVTGVMMPFVEFPLLLAFLFVLVTFILSIANFGKAKMGNTVFLAFMTLFVSISLSSIVWLRNFDRFEYTLPLILGASVCDVFCYVCGMLFGKHKLCPNISPKKTVEGAVGGALITSGAFVLYAYLVGFNLVTMAVVGVLVGIFSQIGDLTASIIKREFDVKDFSQLIPGHGGIMDRVDSWIFTAPIIYTGVSILSSIGGL